MNLFQNTLETCSSSDICVSYNNIHNNILAVSEIILVYKEQEVHFSSNEHFHIEYLMLFHHVSYSLCWDDIITTAEDVCLLLQFHGVHFQHQSGPPGSCQFMWLSFAYGDPDTTEGAGWGEMDASFIRSCKNA